MINIFREELLIARKDVEKKLSTNSKEYIKATSFCRLIEIGINKLEENNFNFSDDKKIQISTIKSHFRLLYKIINNESEEN